MNQQIRAPQLRVIGQDGRQLGIITRQEALQIAEQEGLDLVEVSPEANPPVAKIVDWVSITTRELNSYRRLGEALRL